MSSGLSAAAQEWKPAFASTTTSETAPAVSQPNPTNAATGVVHPGYYPATSNFGPPEFYDSYYYANPWQVATMGEIPQQNVKQQRRRHSSGPRPNGKAASNTTKSKRRKKKKKKKTLHGDSVPRKDATPQGELLPNKVLVFKNLPFSFTVEELESIIFDKCGLKPETTSFHRDKNGQFKGFCFVYFPSVASATVVLQGLHNFELQGRKWTVEFKRVANDDSSPSLVPTSRRTTNNENKSGSLSAMGMGFKHGLAGVRQKFRSASESDADMNWRRTKSEADFPPKDEAGRQIYNQMLEYKERHARLGRNTSSPPASGTDITPEPLLVSIAPSQRHLQRLVQECLKRLNLDHRIKDEAGEQVTYEITPRNVPHGMSGLGMGSLSPGEVIHRRRRGVSTGAFDYRFDNRRTGSSNSNFSLVRECPTMTAEDGLTARQAADRQAAKLAAARSSNLAAHAPVVKGTAREDRTESRDFGGHYASGPDGSPGFLKGPRGRIRQSS